MQHEEEGWRVEKGRFRAEAASLLGRAKAEVECLLCEIEDIRINAL
jgi:hypothetical protein